jgi:hypothetical protein
MLQSQCQRCFVIRRMWVYMQAILLHRSRKVSNACMRHAADLKTGKFIGRRRDLQSLVHSYQRQSELHDAPEVPRRDWRQSQAPGSPMR